MAKRLDFSSEDGRIFEMVHEGYHAAGRPATPDERRLNNKILEALESISDPDPSGKPVAGFRDEYFSPQKRVLKPEGGSFILEDEEYAFLTKALKVP